MYGCALGGDEVGTDGEGLVQGGEVGVGDEHDVVIGEKVRFSLMRAILKWCRGRAFN